MGAKADKTADRIVLGVLIISTLACMAALIVAFCLRAPHPALPIPHS